MTKSTKILLTTFVILLIIAIPYLIWSYYNMKRTPSVSHFVCNSKECKIMALDRNGRIVSEQPVNRDTMDGFGVPNCYSDSKGIYQCHIWIYEKGKKIGGYPIGAIPVTKVTVTPVERDKAKEIAKSLNKQLKEKVLNIDIKIPEIEMEIKEKKFLFF